MRSWHYIALLLAASIGLSVDSRKINPPSECSYVKESFLPKKPTVAKTITELPEYDGSLELCRFTNHTESKRVSCCTHDTENELLLTAQAEYTSILDEQTSVVIQQMEPGANLPHHFERMIAISKRMTEYEMGNAFRLHHAEGREAFTEFYNILENILMSYNRNTSIFTATDNLVDRLFVYVVREATTPGSHQEPNPDYADCVKRNRRALYTSPFPAHLQNQATSLHYSAVAASYLSEAMDVTFQSLQATKDFQLSHHCLRDLMKLNHCQKCYGYTNLRPCREFCEDVFLICLNRVVRLSSNWEYHRKIMKILSQYIVLRVDLQPLMNTFHTELKANFDAAIIAYPSYKKQLSGICGPPRMSSEQSRIKIWEKPHTTSYDGDFTGDLRKLVVNLELSIQGFYSNLPSSICANEPRDGMTCWDGLTERKNKKKVILEFTDVFAPYPDKNEEVLGLIDQIRRIRAEVLKIFLKSNKQNSDDAIEGSGSGDGEIQDYDTEPGDDNVEVLPSRSPSLGNNNPINSVTSKLSTIYQDVPKDSSIEIIERPITPKPSPKTSRAPSSGNSPVKDTSVVGSTAPIQTHSLLALLSILTVHIFIHQ